MAVLKDLIVQGNSRFINRAQFEEINAQLIGAKRGVFNELVATSLDAETATIEDLTAQNATVVGLLDVQGELHTNSWTNSNIATIDGSFYICPTISGANQIQITRAVTSNVVNWTIVLTGNFAIENSVYTKSSGGNASFATWSAGSKVAITGEALVGQEWLPLGTLLGTINAISTTSITLTGVHDNNSQDSAMTLERVGSITPTGSEINARNIKISLYEFYQNIGYNPIGIYMTSTAGEKSKTFIDIYGGGNKIDTASNYILATETSVDAYKKYYSKSGTTYTEISDPSGDPSAQGWYVLYDSNGLALPNLRIGNLNGIEPFGVGDNVFEPTGWGIYTDNGYFKGTIVANNGTIGGFSLNAEELYYGSANPGATDTTFVIYPTGTSQGDLTSHLIPTDGGTSDNIEWAFSIGQTLGITTEGKLYALGAAITGDLTVNNDAVATNTDIQDLNTAINEMQSTFEGILNEHNTRIYNNEQALEGITPYITVNNILDINNTEISSLLIGLDLSNSYAISINAQRAASFVFGAREFAYIDTTQIYAPAAQFVNFLQIANFRWVNRDGRLTLVKAV